MLADRMRQCNQTPTQTILQHGEAVATKFKDLAAGRTSAWRLPAWFESSGTKLLASCPAADILETYHIFHDCGKPFCRTVDEEGRQHFPDHARISAAVWRASGGSEQIAQLIQRDMDCHTMKAGDIATYDRPDLLPPLLLTALCELHANAELFGGIESTSFKIKFKALSKLGNAFTQLKETS